MSVEMSPGSRPTLLHACGEIDAMRVLARLLLAGVVLAFAALFVTPWQQSLPGEGRVTAYAPVERQTRVEAPMAGRVVRWHVQEGDHVAAGDPIVDMRDNDPQLAQRVERQRQALSARRDAASLAIAVAEAKVASLELARDAAVTGAEMNAAARKERQVAAHRALEAARARLDAAERQAGRLDRLAGSGLVSQRKRELARMELRTAQAEVKRAQARARALRSEVKGRDAEVDRVRAKAEAEVEAARASLQKARENEARAQADLAKIEVQGARQEAMRVTAPRAGTVLRVLGREGTEMAKPGDILAILVPDAEDRAVELWIDGNDAPLVTPGRHVRLQFEGWPAVQFVGWPSVAVGSFGGQVAFVDAQGDGEGRFRVLVVPDGEDPWPAPRYLRQGVRVRGWILLNRVSLGYELWRQFNGFPPSIQPPPAGGGGK